MTKTKGKQVASSNTELDTKHSPPLPSPKKQKGMSINEPSEASHTQQANPQTPISGCKKVRKHITTKHVNIQSKLVSPPQDPNPDSHVLPLIAQRSLSRLKAEGEHTILEEHQFMTNMVMRYYPAIWAIIKFHRLKQFTKAITPYVPYWVREFYDAYAKALPKKRKSTIGKL
ncbi:hypothetical protein KY285_007642 [Solanum tuberosum]|nr:hypothetical protein KY289_007965 [Solanum tuberosum]KAH0745985.1 hypothetical protein KY285_007642 [Solanum tuberosum]